MTWLFKLNAFQKLRLFISGKSVYAFKICAAATFCRGGAVKRAAAGRCAMQAPCRGRAAQMAARYSMLFKDSIISIFLRLRYMTRFIITEKANVMSAPKR